MDIGIIGLGVMGRNLALNMADHGFSVVVYDFDNHKRNDAVREFSGRDIIVFRNIRNFLDELDAPKKIMLMVPAGNAVDTVIEELMPLLKKNDIIIDGGNSHFPDTERRWKSLKEHNILFLGTGVSGGEEGALKGPSIMPGGNPDAWPVIEPVFRAISAKTDEDDPCCEWIGEGGAGHFVKMVHNGIEYADMQMICEVYMIMDQVLGLSPEEMQVIFTNWNSGELNSYLIEITSNILGKKDEETGLPMIDVIMDKAGQKGTGKWTSQIALDLGIPVPSIAEAVFARNLSAKKSERIKASKNLKGPQLVFEGDKDSVIEDLRQALFLSKICSYAQGFHLMKEADAEYKWNLKYSSIASVWRAGCIIRAQFLNEIKRAFESNQQLQNLLLDDYFKSKIRENQDAWRQSITLAVKYGIPVPSMSSALAYYDSYRTERLPANLLQAQRDYFGAHTYERLDKPEGEFFHTDWTKQSS